MYQLPIGLNPLPNHVASFNATFMSDMTVAVGLSIVAAAVVLLTVLPLAFRRPEATPIQIAANDTIREAA